MPRALDCAFTLALTLVSASVVDAKVHTTLPRPNPFVDPKHDPYNPLKYIASNTLTAIAFSLVLVVAFIQTWLIFKRGARWMASMTIGAYFFALGLSFRFGLHFHPQSRGFYILEYLFVVLPPCAFIAADYVLLGRLSKHLGGDKYLLIPSQRITVVYVSSDISTFLIQAVGGALSASANDASLSLVGSRVFLGGLAAQLLSFISFMCILTLFLYRLHKHERERWHMDKEKVWYKSWLALAGALVLSCIGILIRSVYRVVELSEGFDGPLTTSESLFYGLDTLPLFIAIAIYIPFWPGRFISDDRQTDKEVAEKTSAELSESGR